MFTTYGNDRKERKRKIYITSESVNSKSMAVMKWEPERVRVLPCLVFFCFYFLRDFEVLVLQ
jgi:hypothetical protein